MTDEKPARKRTPSTKTSPSVKSDNVITTTSMTPKAKAPAPPKPVEPEPEMMAVYSAGNLHHPNIGRLLSGYSVISVTEAEKWFAISPKVRKASPEEVASAFGV